MKAFAFAAFGLLVFGVAASTRQADTVQDALVLVQAPHTARGLQSAATADEVQSSSRLVLSKAPFSPQQVRVLSSGLAAVEGPIISYEGRKVLFAGKPRSGDWQIYEVGLSGGAPRALTAMPGGAQHPALLPDGCIVFSSPAGSLAHSVSAPQLYLQAPAGKPRQITFSPGGAVDPTMLQDGRILFVSAQPETGSGGQGLYTVNNDGTEITPFACQHDQPSILKEPRQLNDGRLSFLVESPGNTPAVLRAECVRMARPFASRAALLPDAHVPIRSVRASGESNLLVCAQTPEISGRWACFRVSNSTASLTAPLSTDSSWDIIEAVDANPARRPMGRISTMEPAKRTGQILCLNINDTTFGAGDSAAKAVRVRLLAKPGEGQQRVLGEVAVQADGSFMAEVPADTALGFEALDQQGQVVRREEPLMWVRSGENRICVGCHAAHNRAPHNHRPIAVRVPLPRLCDAPDGTFAQKSAQAR